MVYYIKSRRFESIEDLASGLQTALKQGKAIDLPKTNLDYAVNRGSEQGHDFCKYENRVGLIRQNLPLFDSVMTFVRGEQGLFLLEDGSQLRNYSISGSYSFSRTFFNYDDEKRIINIGGEIVLSFDDHNPLSLRASIGSLEEKHLDSEEYAPRVGELKPTKDLDGLEFLAQEIYCLER